MHKVWLVDVVRPASPVVDGDPVRLRGMPRRAKSVRWASGQPTEGTIVTSGERMVWAAEFVAAIGRGANFAKAATCAADMVSRLRRAIGAGDLGNDASDMHRDMLSNGGDR